MVSKITLQLVPCYEVQQAVYTGFSIEDILTNFREMINSVNSFSWIVDWPEGETRGQGKPGTMTGRHRLLVRRFQTDEGPAPEAYQEECWGAKIIEKSRTTGPWYQLMCTGQPTGTDEDPAAYGSAGTCKCSDGHNSEPGLV